MNAKSMSGKWKNQHGSILDFQVKRDGDFTGSFITKKGNPRVTGKKHGLKGKIRFPIITFIVDFDKPPFQSHTAWVGRFEKKGGKYELRTIWVLATDCKDDNGTPKKLDEWETFQTNADIFKKGR